MSEQILQSMHFRVGPEPLEPSHLIELVKRSSCGALLLFVGTTRDHFNDRKVVDLKYEAYEDLAVTMMSEIAQEMERQWPGTVIAIEHRTGTVEVMEASVAIAVSAPHRHEAYLASRYAIDELKKRVPIWKLERFEQGAHWKANQL